MLGYIIKIFFYHFEILVLISLSRFIIAANNVTVPNVFVVKFVVPFVSIGLMLLLLLLLFLSLVFFYL